MGVGNVLRAGASVCSGFETSALPVHSIVGFAGGLRDMTLRCFRATFVSGAPDYGQKCFNLKYKLTPIKLIKHGVVIKKIVVREMAILLTERQKIISSPVTYTVIAQPSLSRKPGSLLAARKCIHAELDGPNLLLRRPLDEVCHLT